MQLIHLDRVPCLTIPEWISFSGLKHAIFTRRGGCSREPFDSLNVAFRVGDAACRVKHNRRRITAALKGSHYVFAHQTHGTDGVVLRGDVAFPENGGSVLCGDALITDIPGIRLVIQVADCQAVLLYDRRRRVVANIHAGWRGSVAGIIGKTVRRLQQVFGCRPPDLSAAISPSLGPCCAEFVNYRREIPRRYWAYKDRRDRFDFWALSRDQLIESGVPADCIHISRLCTRCRTDLFFSYRAQKQTGRFAAVIGLD